MAAIKLRLKKESSLKIHQPGLLPTSKMKYNVSGAILNVIINISEFIAPLIWRRGSNDQFNAYEVQILCHAVKRDIIIPNFSFRKNINGTRTWGPRFPFTLFSQSYFNFIFSRIAFSYSLPYIKCIFAGIEIQRVENIILWLRMMRGEFMGLA